MKQFLSESPFIRLLIAFIIGIIIQYYSDFNYAYAFAFLLLILSINVFVFFTKQHVKLFKRRFVHGFFLFLLISSTSIFVASLKDNKLSESHFCHYANQANSFKLLIDEDPKLSEKGLKLKAEVQGIHQDSVNLNTIGKITVFINDTSMLCHYGDIIICKGVLSPIAAAQNPYEFDNNKFAAHKNIYYQLYIQKADYKIIAHHQCNLVLSKVHQLRQYLSHCFESSIENQQAESVAKALILGDDDDIDNTLMQAYSSCGVIHVLSVSGLHVGIFYIIINYLFALIKKENKKILITKALLIILLVWFYAALSGFSPSVLRSAVMLSFIAFGNALSRKINIYNSLSASALFLLFYNCNYLFDVGFQLSYISVFGILYLQPKIYHSWAIKNYLGDKIWQMTSVSLAAQFVTFPLSIFYFYQFPSLFLFANLIIIPLITIALFAGFFFLLMCSITSHTWLFYTVKPLEYLLIFINKFILWMDSIPYNSIKGIVLSPAETLLMYIVFVLLFFWLELRQVKLLQLFLGTSLVLMILLSFDKITTLQNTSLIIYSLNKCQRIEIIHQGFSQVITDKHLDKTNKNFMFHINPYRIHQKVKQENETIIEKGNYEITYEKKHLLIINSRNQALYIPQLRNYYDLVVVGHNAISNFADFKNVVHYQHLVFDNSNSAQFITDAKENLLSFHNIKSEKAFVMNL